MKETWAIIPARGGSKGLPRKNIRPLEGRPLIAYSIEAARDADRVIVSTDDPEIADVAREWGAEVPFLRPAELATDKALVRDAVFHTLDTLVEKEGRAPEAAAILFPTSPLRPPGMLRDLVALLDRSFLAVTFTHVPERQMFRFGPDGSLDPIEGLRPGLIKPMGLGSVLHYAPPGFRPWESRGRFLKWAEENDKPTGYGALIINDPRCLVDVDTVEDLEAAAYEIHH